MREQLGIGGDILDLDRPSRKCRTTGHITSAHRSARAIDGLHPLLRVGGRLHRRLDLEHAAYPAPGGEATTERGAASEQLAELRQRLAGPRTRLRRAADIDFQLKTILEKTTSFATSRSSAPCVRVISTSNRGQAGQVPLRPFARSPSAASISNGGSTRTPSPTTTRAMACIR